MEQTAQNLTLVPTMPDKMNLVSPLLEKAQGLVLRTKEDVATARIFGKEINTMISTIKDDFKKSKKAADDVHKAVCAQEQNHLNPLEKAKGLVAQKMAEWDQRERQRIADEQCILQQEEERKRQAALKLAQDKLDKLTMNITDNQDKLKVLEDRLSDPTITDEEAELIRSSIRTVQAKINSTVERAQVIEQKVEEVAQTTVAPINTNTVKTATGVSQKKAITAINTKVLLRYLASEDCIVSDVDTLLEWKEGAIKKLIQTMNLPGVSWKYESAVKF